ncbi:TRAP transporter large permease subunit [Alphaproteobacteria bacterium]|nr:TRAP transporter large permease subunit [Alphaproteobacteria bacterium]
MELLFLAILFVIMITALGSGYPVAFALPGAAIITIALAGATGVLFDGDSGAYFVRDGPVEWLTAGVTNFRGIYWEVERDTLIAIPLFIFMGIMLQRSKVAEDLLVTMAQLFGPVPGGLGISVVFVGALLAATTGIVGATVVAMGLISLPAMLRNNYSKPLATGTICASGTLGQIIPPSIVLIILADQLSNAVDQASSERRELYKAATGETSMPSSLEIVSTSAGDMFLGAFIPGLLLVLLYMLYIFGSALLRPETAPAVSVDGKIMTRPFLTKVVLSLIPPLLMIFAVLGSILMGIATVNQAGAIGAIGATLMASYRLAEGRKDAFYPVILMATSILLLTIIIMSGFNLKILTISSGMDYIGLALALTAVTGLLVSIGWALVRSYRIDNTLHQVMLETAKTTSMVFIILLGAAMLTAAFRAFGGEEIVKHGLGSLPGGFWTQFFVVMLVIFLLGFFLDFIEIAVVVVPIVAPILLADPSANITAVWLGVMVGLNIQTSFLTPPFGFALFYLRGVASSAVKTIDIYKGVVPFIILQLIGLGVVGYYPQLVNYLPTRSYLTGDTSPPPRNPRLQQCLKEYTFAEYAITSSTIRAEAAALAARNMDKLDTDDQNLLKQALANIPVIFDHVDKIAIIESEMVAMEVEYAPLHTSVRRIERDIRRIENRKDDIKKDMRNYRGTSYANQLKAEIAAMDKDIQHLLTQIPVRWDAESKAYQALTRDLIKTTRLYNRTSERAYNHIVTVIEMAAISDPELASDLAAFEVLIRDNIGILAQNKVPVDIAREISACLAVHRNLSLYF